MTTPPKSPQLPISPLTAKLAQIVAAKLRDSDRCNSWTALNLPMAAFILCCLIVDYSFIAHVIALLTSFNILTVQIWLLHDPITRPLWILTYHTNGHLPWYGDIIVYTAIITSAYTAHFWLLFAILVSLALVDLITRYHSRSNIPKLLSSVTSNLDAIKLHLEHKDPPTPE